MRYKQIIFDVDDTIIDFAATEDFALHSLFNAMCVESDAAI